MYIVKAYRSAVGKAKKGSFKNYRSDDLAVKVIEYLMEQTPGLDPSLIDEELFQQARQIVIAEMQQVTYSEFLPVVLGKHTMDMYHLNLPSTPV